MKNNWSVAAVDAEMVARLEKELEIPHLMAQVLASRGMCDVEEARRFLSPSMDRDWHDPTLIPGLPQAVDRIERAIREGTKTVIFGDFDVDGITATAVMLLGLGALGLQATPFIPRRQDEGYGLSIPAVDRILGTPGDDGQEVQPSLGFVPQLVITVDCGITSESEVDYLLSKGVDVVVTDHHNPLNSVPQGVPVCNPKLDPSCPSGNLAGVGVALKVMQELGSRFGKPDLWKGLIDLAALGTIADRMPLRDENRALVAAGVERIRQYPRPGIAASLELAGDRPEEVTSISLSFSLIPRLNAAGRMTDAAVALDLLLSDEPVQARALAQNLEDVNALRRSTEIQLTDSADQMASVHYSGGRVLVLAGEGWHEGVKGIVASRMANKYGVPTILFTIEGDVAHGSGRSVGKVDLFDALAQAEDLIVKFGGHKYAAGVTVKARDLPKFEARLEAYFDKLSEDDFVSTINIDGLVNFEDLSLDQVTALDALQPYGQDNMEPVFAISHAFINRARAVGALKNHLSFSITNGATNATAIYFHCDDTEDYMSCMAPVDLVFSAEVEEWRGRRQVKLKVSDMETAPLRPEDVDAEASAFVERMYQQDAGKIINRMPITATRNDEQYEQEAVWILPNQEDDDFGHYDLAEELAIALTGSKIHLHQAQRKALDCLRRGKSTLVVMATGRGKSLIFYVHAARMALDYGRQSIFVYPLRALINDQAFHMAQSFAKLGITVEALTGESSPQDRAKIFEAWARGELDVILTTPEFLKVHASRLSSSGNVGFIAVDEAHHVGTANNTHRPVYARLGFVRTVFPGASVLAVTATAPHDHAMSIVNELAIEEVVTDTTMRYNLRLDDKREVHDRLTYLATIVATGEKTVVYVNSRQATIDIARSLRKRLPEMAMSIVFYNAGLSHDMRLRVEELFRNGDVRCVVATSAFGEGVNVPDIRHAVMFHMPFSPLSFNQMAGRCGRDGKTAYIHLLFSQSDVAINSALLQENCPPRDHLVMLYSCIRAINEQRGAAVSETELLEALSNTPDLRATINMVRSGVGVFEELGLVDVEEVMVQGMVEHMVSVRKDAPKADISSSIRYQEAESSLHAFTNFSMWMMNDSPGDLLAGINRPLLPGFPRQSDQDDA